MSQKTILSFFKQAETPTTNINSESCSANSKSKKSYAKDNSKNSKLNGDAKIASETEKSNSKKELRKSIINNNAEKSINNDHNGDSPVKQSKKRKRAKIIESDDDSNSSDELPKKTHDKPCDGTNENDEMDSSEVAPTSHMLDKPVAKSDQMSSNNRTTAQPAKRKKDAECVKSDKEDNTESSKKKKTKDNSSTVNYNDNIPANNDTNEKNSLATPSTNHSALTDDEKSSVDFIPKRKTARKQMRGGKQKIGKVSENLNKSPVKKENGVSTSNDENKLESDEEIKNKNSEKSDEEVHISKVKKESDSDEKPGDSKPNQVNKESSKKESDVNTNPKKNQVVHPFFASQKKENTSPKKENTSPKKENSSPKKENTTPKKESPDKEVKSSSSTGTVYDPTKGRYHPVDDACWKRNEKVPYLALAKTLELIENTSARLKIVEILSNFLRSVIVLTPEDLLYSVYLCLNRLAPEYEGIELGIGDMLLMRAVAQATGRTVDKIKAEVAVKGDLGLVAESSRGNQRVMFAPPKLTVSSVFSKFKEIAKMSGNTVQSKKTDKIQVLFVACRECEAKYIIRSLSGKMRIGLAEQSVLAALARAAVLTPPNQSYPPEIMDKSSGMSADKFKEHLIAQTLILKTTYCECPNFDLLIPVLLREGIAGLPEHCQLSPGCPLKPMLAHPTNGIDEVLNRFDRNEFTCEYKYDGERAQIHRTDKGEVKIFSRNQEDNTSKYPDVISRLTKALNDSTKSFILDTEAVAWDCETKQILPFQVLSTRKKKDAVESDIVVQVCIMAFDLLYLNGESLVKNTLKERRELLHSAFTEVTNEFMFVNYRDGDSAETMQEFLDESVKGNCEGLMVKALTVDASYEIAKRSHNWLKLKKDYLKGVGDTLDLVVIGGYHGKGKRTGTYGGFLLACYDDDNEEFQSICKLGTGFSEVELDTHTKFLKQHILKEPRSYYRYDSALEPDDWFDAVQIWEIKCADLSISPVHKAAIGIVDPERGISLRFPRFLRIREDKAKPEDATPSSMIANMYQSQEQVQNTKNKNARPEEDYY